MSDASNGSTQQLDKPMTNFEMQYLFTQYGILVVTIFFYFMLVRNDNQREKRAIELEIKQWCKHIFRATGGTGGLLQTAGERVRTRYPSRIKLILVAYDELLVEEPNLGLPSLSKFLELMEMVERGHWPSSGAMMSGKFKIFK